tara:strand:- start:594 stop:809 length:216 start_codon:yes stop_codon:yes gene_type:complete
MGRFQLGGCQEQGKGYQQKEQGMSLYENINKRKKAGTSRSKKKSTISDKSYADMKAGFPKKKKSVMGRKRG